MRGPGIRSKCLNYWQATSFLQVWVSGVSPVIIRQILPEQNTIRHSSKYLVVSSWQKDPQDELSCNWIFKYPSWNQWKSIIKQIFWDEECTYLRATECWYGIHTWLTGYADMHYVAGFSNLTHILVMYSGDTSTHILCTRILVYLNSNKCDAEEVRSCADEEVRSCADTASKIDLTSNTLYCW